MPTPRDGETRQEFIDRCMSDSEAVTDFPDADQRLAVCNNLWENRKMNFGEMEQKDVSFEVKEVGDQGSFTGMGAIFDIPDQGGDVIDKGAFDKTLEEARRRGKWPKMLFQHDPSAIVGVYTNMKTTDEGLFVEGRLLRDTTLGNDTFIRMREGALDGLSIGYQTIDAEFDGMFRKLLQVKLWEVSVVTFPMQANARVSGIKKLETVRDAERVLRDGGVPGEFASLVAKYGFEEATNRVKSNHREGGNKSRYSQDDLRSIRDKILQMKGTLA